jgi:hypothetical protein
VLQRPEKIPCAVAGAPELWYYLDVVTVNLYSNTGTFADVAQLAEQLICNQQVIGSSPIIGFLRIISSVG